MYNKICLQCGNAYQTIMSFSKYCCDKCRNKHSRINGISKEYTCKNCGKAFRPKKTDRTTFCSRECAYIFKKAKPKERKITVCDMCGKEFQGGGKQCSDVCRKAKNRFRFKETFKSVKETNQYTEKKCAYCGTIFKTNFYAKARDYCSPKCNKKKEKELRKIQIKGAFVENIYYEKIYKRDSGTCQICGLPVKNDKEPSDSMGATIDHVIPLSKGGKHCYSNCQLAHRLCNSLKSDKIV